MTFGQQQLLAMCLVSGVIGIVVGSVGIRVLGICS